MKDYIFDIKTQINSHISAFILDQHSIKCSSKKHDSYFEFEKSWDSELATTKVEIMYDKIKQITKPENNNLISIEYKVGVLPSWFMFYFDKPEDYNTFFNYLTTEKQYQKTVEKLTLVKAISKMDSFLVMIVVGIALASYFFGNESRNLNVTFGIAGIFIVFMLVRAWLRLKKSSNLISYFPPNR